MASYNRVILVGNLTRDPQVRYTPSSTAVCEIGLAVSRQWFDKQSNTRKEETTFVDVTLWGRQAEVAGEYLSKGRPVLIEGRLQLDQWEDKNTGDKRSKLRVVGESMQMLGSRGDGGGGGGGNRGGDQASQQQSSAPPQQKTSAPQQSSSNEMPPSPVDSFYDSTPDDEVPF
ncbi:MAG: single-stranded DNA-binding protein [Planctomycetaceae bacterium]|nr:single-stranded DNA-binding protein [Planctomycetaceae bacterium]